MRKVRFNTGDGIFTGTVENGSFLVDGQRYESHEVEIMPPCNPSKIVAVGKNYIDHVRAILGNVEKDEFPLLFFKPPSSVIGHGDNIVSHQETHFVDYEAELALVVGEECSSVSESEALEYIEGFTCLNDVTARDWQAREDQWARGKGLDTFCPIGPYLQTDLQESLDVICRVNGEVRQSSNTDNLLFPIPKLVAEISSFCTLFPGDVIATGTPAGTSAETVPQEEWTSRSADGALEPGDTVEVEIESVGKLKNSIVSP